MDTVIADKKLVCPNCEAVGVIEGIAHEVVPEQIQCLACHSIFPFQPNRYDFLRQDYDGEVAVWPMRVTKRPQRPQEAAADPEPARLASLAAVSTKRLLDAFRGSWLSRDNHGGEGAVRDEALIRTPGGSFTGAEIRAELATREHIPNKREARALRQTQAKKPRKGRRYDL
jgi:hypothetical protein